MHRNTKYCRQRPIRVPHFLDVHRIKETPAQSLDRRTVQKASSEATDSLRTAADG